MPPLPSGSLKILIVKKKDVETVFSKRKVQIPNTTAFIFSQVICDCNWESISAQEHEHGKKSSCAGSWTDWKGFIGTAIYQQNTFLKSMESVVIKELINMHFPSATQL